MSTSVYQVTLSVNHLNRCLKSVSKVSQIPLNSLSKVSQHSVKSLSKVSQKSLKSRSKVAQKLLKSRSKVAQKLLKSLVDTDYIVSTSVYLGLLVSNSVY